MSKKSQDVLPGNLNTLGEFSDFWGTHSTADYEEIMDPVEAEIGLASGKVYCPTGGSVKCALRAVCP
jgi:hypothetical protein